MIEQIFFELIRVAIGTQDMLSRPPSGEEWKLLYDMAKKQSLVGICFAGVQRLVDSEKEDYCGMPEMLYLTWMGMAAKIQQRNEVVNRQCVELEAKISADGYRSYIMKGQGNAVLYNDLALLRQSGDIDVYLEGGLDKVLAYANTFAPTNGVNELEMHVDVFPDTEVEFHYRPFIMRNPFKNRKLQRFFAEAMRFDNKVNLPNGVGSINVPTIEFNLVHQLVHIYHHLFTEGIGLRQLLDYYFLLRSVKSVENVKDSKECIHSLGLDSFASALMWVLRHVFGLPEEQMLWTPNEKDGQFLLNEIMLAGNFGKYDERLSHEEVSKWQSFWRVNARNLRLLRFNKTDWFWGPLWRIYHFAWRKAKGFE